MNTTRNAFYKTSCLIVALLLGTTIQAQQFVVFNIKGAVMINNDHYIQNFDKLSLNDNIKVMEKSRISFMDSKKGTPYAVIKPGTYKISKIVAKEAKGDEFSASYLKYTMEKLENKKKDIGMVRAGLKTRSKSALIFFPAEHSFFMDTIRIQWYTEDVSSYGVAVYNNQDQSIYKTSTDTTALKYWNVTDLAAGPATISIAAGDNTNLISYGMLSTEEAGKVRAQLKLIEQSCSDHDNALLLKAEYLASEPVKLYAEALNCYLQLMQRYPQNEFYESLYVNCLASHGEAKEGN